jgi:hypothetical protein
VKEVVRISGLVKLADTIRLEIGRGVGRERKQQLQQTVSRSIAQINQILKNRYAKPEQLAGPSRRAYQFLTEIRWDAIPESRSEQSPPPQPLRWTGLGRFADRIAVRLAGIVSEAELEEIAKSVEQMSRRIELSIQQAGVGPEHLTAPTREWRAWFAWLAERENLRQYIAAVGRARTALETAARTAGKTAAFIVQFRPSRHIYKLQPRAAHSIVVLPTPMVVFDEAGFADLATLVFSHSKDAKRQIVERMRIEPYTEVAADLEGLAGVVEGTRGAFHDLVESFDRVNARYFEGKMPRPNLTWSRSFTGRKFGHYDTVKDWVMVSSTLDRPSVPAFVVDFLMFHELLHKKHGIRWVNQRGHAHTRDFYEEERRFERYQEAEDWLTKLARG